MLYADTTSTAGGENLCPRCGGSVFQAEEIVEKGLSYHKRQCYQLYQLENCNSFFKKAMKSIYGFFPKATILH